jgi:Flp pilus assembly protein TadB
VSSRYYIDTLFSDPIGRLAAIAGGPLVLLGLYLNHKIAQVEL